ncbi:exopolysaccharide biosynthesis polyprenyl glycosylphosphotransferase [Streptomyces sp. NPDC047097]|uniref:exopolysaccharide biosynthesis polyprenyl glycosylphosphotransferase n=1 Tax=Streptomyces sp. NPDC047097 TaxID=3155260 RepID=UPI0033D1AE4E
MGSARPVPVPPFTAALVAVDCAAVLLGGLVLAAGLPGRGLPSAGLLLQLTALLVVLDAYAGLYRTASPLPSLAPELPALAGRAAVVWCAAAALLANAHPGAAGWAAPAVAYAVHLLAVCAGRAVLHGRHRRAVRARPRAALVVGRAAEALRLAAVLAEHPEYGLRPVAVFDPDRVGGAGEPRTPEPRSADPAGGAALPVLGAAGEVQRAVVRGGVSVALFTGPGSGPERDEELAALLADHGCAGVLVGTAAGTAPMDRHLWGHAWRRIDAPPECPGGPGKRLLDLALAAPALLLLAPVLLGCAAAVRLADGPGVLFRQERVGQHGRLFTLLKFRTLRPADDDEAATRWSVARDTRLGPVGSFLRRTSLDELPQLWNVLRGDMSLVGPRPERPYFVAEFSRLHPGYAARHRMPVGLTGLAQVHGLRGDTSIEDRCRFDNHYIDHWSLWQDVCILVRTAVSLLRPAGS